MYKTIEFRTEAAVAYITFNRPESYNAINDLLGREFIEVLEKCRENEDIRAVVLTGNGKAFCSGQDLKDPSAFQNGINFEQMVEERYNRFAELIIETPKPFIASLNGVAAGAGAGIALACDHLIAAENASLVFAFTNIGLIPDTATHYTLARTIGIKKAFQLLALGQTLNAEQALQLGLIHQIVPQDKLTETAAQLAYQYAQRPTKAIGFLKTILNQAHNLSLHETLQMEKKYQNLAGHSQDFMEGVQAFLQKRKPEFKGK